MRIVTVFLGFLLLTACTRQTMSPLVESFTGEELFSAIFFLEGSPVSKISQLKSLKDEINSSPLAAELKSNIDSVRVAIIKTISQNNPGFFYDFRSDIQSGNHLKIQHAVKSGAVLLKETSELMYKAYIDEFMMKIQGLTDKELQHYFRQDYVSEIVSLKEKPKLLREFLFNDFLSKVKFDSSSDQACLAVGPAIAVGVVLYVAVAGAIDIVLSMNVVMALNHAIASYTYFAVTGESGQVYMFLNIGFIRGGNSGGEKLDPERREPGENRRVSVIAPNLFFEMFINEVAEELCDI